MAREFETPSELPSYLIAANNHNIANNNESWGDVAVLGTGAVIGSAAVQAWNILPTVGNWLGGDFELAKTKDILQDFDSDLGRYYQNHQEGVDALGFALSSIVPGMAGVKVLKAGQVMLRGAAEFGTLGTNMRAATGLLPSQPKVLSAAIEAALKPNAGFPIWNSETMKAVALGFGQSALEGAAWETAVAATMYNGPVLQKQDLGDITSNILWGAGAFGVLGGVINTAGIYSKIKGASKALESEMMAVTSLRELPTALPKADRILAYIEDAHYTKVDVPSATHWTGEHAWKNAKYESLKAEKLRTIDDKVRTLTGELAGGDEVLATHLFTEFKAMKMEQVEAKLYGTTEVARLGQKTATEARLKQIGTRYAEKLEFASAEDEAFFMSRQATFVKLTGEDAGKVTTELPTVWNLGDKLSKGETISVTAKGVEAGKLSFKFAADKAWDIAKADHFEAESRQIWASKLPKFEQQTMPAILESDIPMLDKAFKDGVLPQIKLAGVGTEKSAVPFTSRTVEDSYGKKIQGLSREFSNNNGGKGYIELAVTKDRMYPVMVDNAIARTGKYSGAVTQVYEDAIAEATRRGLNFTSDSSVTLEAARVYDALARKGYRIEKNPTARLATKEEAVTPRWITDDNSPVFTVVSGPSVPIRIGGDILTLTTKEQFLEFIKFQKESTFQDLIALGRTPEEAAKMVNVSPRMLQGAEQGALEDNLFAWQKAKRDYEAKFAATGHQAPGPFWEQPTYAKVMKDTSQVTIDNNVVEGLVAIKQKQVLYEQAADRVVADIMGEDTSKFFRLKDTDLNRANRIGPGGGMLSAQNENYGTLGAAVQYLGAQTLKLISKIQGNTREALQPTLYKLGQKQEAAIEWSVLHTRLRQFGETPFGYDAQQQAMRPLALIKYERDIAAGLERELPQFADDVPLAIPIKHAETAALVEQHVALNGTRSTKLGNIRANQGVKWNRDPERFYPIPPNTRDYPFIASVIDDSIAGHGHGKMLYAATAEDLEKQITQVRSADPTLKVLTKGDAESWYKSVGQYEFERTLTDVTFDASMKSRGVSAQYLPATDTNKIIADTLNWHLSRDTAMAREAVSHQNEAQFATLRTMGEKYANVTGSHYSNLDPISYLEMQGKNPYADYVRSALGLSTSKEFPFWTPLNDMLDRKVSGLFNRVYETFANAKSPADLELINKHLAEAGYQGAPYTAMTQAFANHTAPKGALTAFIGKANAILSSAMLGLDPINAVTNVVGSTVLRNTELQSLIRNIKASNTDAAGALARLTDLKVPGTSESIFSPVKMIAKAMGEFHSDAGKALRQEFTARGVISSRVEQSNWVLNNLALTGKESVADLDSKMGQTFKFIKDAAAKGEVLTGNKLAEEFNRFVSGHVVKQITDKAVAAGILGEREAWGYINTFVNRVEGNYIAAQRPGVFQGPIGQAIGLFQTYQFNLAQQLLRHVGEGSAKDVALMMGLQSTIFGMKGLPAFDAINTHLIGNASGNSQHRDLYDTVFGAAGKEAGNWLMYGLGSNALGLISPDLKLNLYSRGDINPRNVTLLPVNPANIPFVQAVGKFFGSVKETATKIGQGGNVWNSFLQGIEHAGISRPLSGLAQTLEALGNSQGRSYSTSNKGNIVASNDFLSLANMIRVAGAKPLDEAIGLDRAFNLEVYAAKDAARRSVLGESIKTTVIAGGTPSQEQVERFAYQYAKAGGKQEKFNQFMMQQFKAANTSQINKLADSLKSPFAQSMQTIMGGANTRDFANDPE